MSPCLPGPPRSWCAWSGSQLGPRGGRFHRRPRWLAFRLRRVLAGWLAGWTRMPFGDEVPRGHHRTTLTACVCFTSVERYVTLRSSPCVSTFQSYWSISNWLGSQCADIKRTLTLLSPPAVARRPLPCGSKCAEYMGAFSLCQDTRSGAAFIVDRDGAHVPGGQGRSRAGSTARTCALMSSQGFGACQTMGKALLGSAFRACRCR